MEKIEFSIISPAGGDIEIFQEIPDIYKHFRLPVFEKMYAKANIGDLFFNYFAGDGFSLWMSVYQIYQSAIVKAWGDFSVLELHIPFKNDLESNWDGKKQFQLLNQQYDISYFPFVNNQTHFKGGQTHQTFDVHYTKEYLRTFADHYPILQNFLKNVDDKQVSSLLNVEQFLDPEMIRIINSILTYEMRDVMAPFFFEGLILQFTTIWIERLSGLNPNRPKTFPKQEIDQAIAAKNIMMKDLSERFTIKQLAQMVGTNAWKLQYVFKSIFHTPIYNYLFVAKMKHSETLIKDSKNYTMQDIAGLVGYPDASNFSAAFKRHFGYPPEYLRSKKIQK